MTIQTAHKNRFDILNDEAQIIASLQYINDDFQAAKLDAPEPYLLNGIATGRWVIRKEQDPSIKIRSAIRVDSAGLMTIRVPSRKRKYLFNKSAGWRLRFFLKNKEGEDILTLIPGINWEKASYDYILQLNDDFEKESDSLLILQAVHCANCCMSMMIGGPVPALISL